MSWQRFTGAAGTASEEVAMKIKKSTYIIIESSNCNAARDGYSVEVSSLAAAKGIASRKQMFKQSVLTISTARGAVLAIKENGVWR